MFCHIQRSLKINHFTRIWFPDVAVAVRDADNSWSCTFQCFPMMGSSELYQKCLNDCDSGKKLEAKTDVAEPTVAMRVTDSQRECNNNCFNKASGVMLDHCIYNCMNRFRKIEATPEKFAAVEEPVAGQFKTFIIVSWMLETISDRKNSNLGGLDVN